MLSLTPVNKDVTLVLLGTFKFSFYNILSHVKIKPLQFLFEIFLECFIFHHTTLNGYFFLISFLDCLVIKCAGLI